MKLLLNQFYTKTNKLDQILIFLISLFPILLSLSIFLADLFASLVAIFAIFFLVSKKNNFIFHKIKRNIYLLFFFYLLILITLFFSSSTEISILPSIFYIRYILFVLGIFYLLEKYDFMKKIIFYSLYFTFIVVSADAIFQFFFFKNILNYPVMHEGMNIITGFFNDEKKLGSYFIRLLPLLLSLVFYLKKDKLIYPILIIAGVIIFLAAERTALFLFFIFLVCYFFVCNHKVKLIIFSLTIVLSLLILSPKHYNKYITYTLQQLGFFQTEWNKEYSGKIQYFSNEHENLAYTAIQIFKKNILVGSGIKTFYYSCSELKIQNKVSAIESGNFNSYSNKLQCSTHPHNYYLQILSDTGIFMFIYVFLFFLFIFVKNLKFIFKKNLNNIELCFYFLNLGIIINLFPFVPSGNFYNNWLSLIMFYPLGFWLYINQKVKDV
jgi:O-antigen ligase